MFATGIWAGVQNALAGGGSFVTLPVLLLSGMDPRAANVTSTVALFPGQLSSGLAGWSVASGAEQLSLRTLVLISLAGGLLGGLLLLATPADFFARLLPWLVLFATAVFAWGSFGRSFGGARSVQVKPATAMLAQALIAIYGGYFGGGIGFLMLAALTMAGLPTRESGAIKNVLAAMMNASAVALFVFSPSVRWLEAAALGTGAVAGGLAGVWILNRLDEGLLRMFIVLLGIALTVGLFVRQL